MKEKVGELNDSGHPVFERLLCRSRKKLSFTWFPRIEVGPMGKSYKEVDTWFN